MTDQMNLKPIVVAMDFSPWSAAALKQAVWLARRTGAPRLPTASNTVLLAIPIKIIELVQRAAKNA